MKKLTSIILTGTTLTLFTYTLARAETSPASVPADTASSKTICKYEAIVKNEHIFSTEHEKES